MDKLSFYTVDLDYVEQLKRAELAKRGYSRVPNMDYGKKRKQKFLCGIVLIVNKLNYYVPVTSYNTQKPDNFLICDKNGTAVSSLRFNYMFPVPSALLKERRIDDEPDQSYRTLLAQELLYCRKNQNQIRYLAQRTYNRVLLGKNPGLVANSCDFMLLEEVCCQYMYEKKQQEGKLEKEPKVKNVYKDFQRIQSFNNIPQHKKKTHDRGER